MTNQPAPNSDNSKDRFPPLSSRERLSLWLPLAFSGAVAVGLWIGFALHSYTQPTFVMATPDGAISAGGQSGKVGEVLRFIDARYLENANMNKLEDAAIEGLLRELDPHSNYIPLADIEEVNESLSGGFEGIGVEFFILDDTVYVVGVLPDGPSARVGLQAGDKIIQVGDSLLSGVQITNKKVVEKLKGSKGSSVDIKIKRGSEAKLRTFTIQRGEIPIRSLDVAYMLDDKTGYVRIHRFSDKTYKEFMEAVENLIDSHQMKDLVIDLRHNPGGYLTAATDILTQLFDAKKLLVYTEGRSYQRKEYHSTGNTFFKVGKLAILIDEGSASASEIMAGAIQDNDRGVVVGRRSFGKGLVQEQYELSDGSALRLTVARYYTPSGRLIQKPYEKGLSDEYDDDLKHRYESGELYYKDSIKISDSTKYYTTGGRVVYGGGGIIPDIFVPLDTIMRNRYFISLNGYVPAFIYKYLDNNRASLATTYKTIDQFLANFKITDKMYSDFVAYTERKGINRNEAILRNAKDEILLYLRATIAQQLFRDEGYYRVVNEQDKTLQRALDELRRGAVANK